MPQILAALPALFATAGPAIAGGVGIGSTINSLLNKPDTSSMTVPAAAPATPAGPTPIQRSGAAQAGANLTAQTGGGLSPESLSQLIGMLDTSGGGFGGGAQAGVNALYGVPG